MGLRGFCCLCLEDGFWKLRGAKEVVWWCFEGRRKEEAVRPAEALSLRLDPLRCSFRGPRRAKMIDLKRGRRWCNRLRSSAWPSPEKTIGACRSRAGLHARPIALGACRHVRANVLSKKIWKNVKKIRKNMLWGFVPSVFDLAFPMSRFLH